MTDEYRPSALAAGMLEIERYTHLIDKRVYKVLTGALGAVSPLPAGTRIVPGSNRFGIGIAEITVSVPADDGSRINITLDAEANETRWAIDEQADDEERLGWMNVASLRRMLLQLPGVKAVGGPLTPRGEPVEDEPVVRAPADPTLTWDGWTPLHEVLAIVSRIVASVREVGPGGKLLDIPVQGPELPWMLSKALLAQDLMPFAITRNLEHGIVVATPPGADVEFSHRIVLDSTHVTWTTFQVATGESRTTVGAGTHEGLAWAINAATHDENTWG